MQLHEAAQKARLSIDFTLDETSSGFAASVAVASRDDELPDAINATSDPMPTRREAEQAAASLVLPSLRETMPHAFPSKPEEVRSMLCLRASPSLHQSRGHMKGHIAFAEAFSHGSLPLGAITANERPLSNAAKREYMSSTSHSACSEQQALHYLKSVANHAGWMDPNSWRLNLRSVAHSVPDTLSHASAWSDVMQADISAATTLVEAESMTVNAAVLPADPAEPPHDICIEIGQMHPYEAFAEKLGVASVAPAYIFRKDSHNGEPLFAFLPLQESFEELPENPRVSMLIGDSAARGAAIVAQARMSFEEPGKLKHFPYSAANVQKAIDMLMPSHQYRQGNPFVLLPMVFSFGIWSWFTCRRPLRLLSIAVNTLGNRLPELQQPSQRTWSSGIGSNIKTAALDLGSRRISQCTLSSPPASKAGAALAALHALDEEVQARMRGEAVSIENLWSCVTSTVTRVIESHSSTCPRMIRISKVEGCALSNHVPDTFTTAIGAHALISDLENAIFHNQQPYEGLQWSEAWAEPPPLWENRVPELFEPSLGYQRVEASMKAVQGSRTVLCAGYSPLQAIDEHIKPAKIIIVDVSLEELKRPVRWLRAVSDEKKRQGERIPEVYAYRESLTEIANDFSFKGIDAIVVSSAFDQLTESTAKEILESLITTLRPKVMSMTNFNVDCVHAIAEKHKEILHLAEAPPWHAVLDNNTLRWNESTFVDTMDALAKQAGYDVTFKTFGEMKDASHAHLSQAAGCVCLERTSLRDGDTATESTLSYADQQAGPELMVAWDEGASDFRVNKVLPNKSGENNKRKCEEAAHV